MDPLPPNDPNRNIPGSPTGRAGAKEDPHDGRQRRRVGGEEPIPVMGDLRDQAPIMVLFFMGLVSFLLRERCVC